MKQGNGLPDWMREFSLTGLLLLLGSVAGWSQESGPVRASSQSDSTAAAIHELQQQVNEFRSAMAEMRSEAEQYRAENAALRHELQAARASSRRSRSPPGIRTRRRRRPTQIRLLPERRSRAQTKRRRWRIGSHRSKIRRNC